MEKKGIFPTVKYKGKYLHSPYNPPAEAEKIISRHVLTDKNLFIFFEPGLGYGVEYIQKVCPAARFLIISPLNLLIDRLRHQRGTRVWYGGEDRETFLLEHIHESDLDGLSYIPWPPSVRLLQEEAQTWNSLIHRVITRLSGNHANLCRFGKKYLRNSIINFLGLSAPPIPLLRDKHVLITASGPSLQKKLEEIRRLRKGYFLLALPSSVKALLSQGIRPDLILSTDGGYWAARHYEFFPREIPVGMTLSGRSDFQNRDHIFPLFSQNTLIDKFFFRDIPLPVVPMAGTVALSAVKYCLQNRAATITLAGLDLCLHDIKSHVSPHSFDTMLETLSYRTNSLHQIYFNRAREMTLRKEGMIRYGHNLSLYREMMKNLSDSVTLYRLSPGTPSLEGWQELDSLTERPAQHTPWSTIAYPSGKERREIIKESLKQWKQIFLEKMNNGGDFFNSPGNDFFDFIYTLSAHMFCLTKQASFHKDNKSYLEQLKRFTNELTGIFREMEDLCERFS